MNVLVLQVPISMYYYIAVAKARQLFAALSAGTKIYLSQWSWIVFVSWRKVVRVVKALKL